MVSIGTRHHKNEGYAIMVHQSDKPQIVTLTLKALPYAASEVHDYFDDKKLATIKGNSFTITVPGIGINSGSIVLRIPSK